MFSLCLLVGINDHNAFILGNQSVAWGRGKEKGMRFTTTYLKPEDCSVDLEMHEEEVASTETFQIFPFQYQSS